MSWRRKNQRRKRKMFLFHWFYIFSLEKFISLFPPIKRIISLDETDIIFRSYKNPPYIHIYKYYSLTHSSLRHIHSSPIHIYIVHNGNWHYTLHAFRANLTKKLKTKNGNRFPGDFCYNFFLLIPDTIPQKYIIRMVKFADEVKNCCSSLMEIFWGLGRL